MKTVVAGHFHQRLGSFGVNMVRPLVNSFAEIVTASREYALEYLESSHCLTLDEAHIAWCLIRLLEYGMAGVVAEDINTTEAVC